MTGLARCIAVLCLLVLSIVVSAVPTNIATRRLGSQQNGNNVIEQLGALQTEIKLIAGTIPKLAVVTDVASLIESLVMKVNVCAEFVVDVGENTDMDSATKRDVVAKVSVIIAMLLNLGAELVTKFGAALALPLITKIDTYLSILALPNVYTNGAQSIIPNM
ncbi:hypothetical protein RSOLAG22IIIB_10317 [Rhizoctonia solani]|uniref:Transmembrane protein n=1 Tax=Rhizoctonia solani TaxID=456999 RepID=A0A0K6G352_9AGAM|nr:hypothetical protein RSOLAG22IIIB_10317 [Rhizoctonia solani]